MTTPLIPWIYEPEGTDMTPPLAVVGLVEIADMLNVERTTVRTWYHRGKLPVPDALLAATPVWRVSTIERWKR